MLLLSEALADELRGTGVTITTLCPGPTRSGFQARARAGNLRLFSLGMMGSEAVAKAGYRGLMAGKTLVVPGWSNQLSVLFVRLGPRRLVTRIVGLLQERRGQPPSA